MTCNPLKLRWGSAPDPGVFRFTLRGTRTEGITIRLQAAGMKKERYLSDRPHSDQLALESHSCVALSSVAGDVRIP